MHDAVIFSAHYRWHQESETPRSLNYHVLQNLLNYTAFVLYSLQKSISLKNIRSKNFFFSLRCQFSMLNSARVRARGRPPGRITPPDMPVDSRSDASANFHDPGRPTVSGNIFFVSISDNPSFCTCRFHNRRPNLIERTILTNHFDDTQSSRAGLFFFVQSGHSAFSFLLSPGLT
jgi:hypothetical protein